MSNNKKIAFSGMDDGFDVNKTTITIDGVSYNIQRPSMAKAGENTQVVLGSGTQKAFSYQSSEGPFVVGEIRDPDTTAFDGYPTSAMNRAMVMHVLREAGLTDEHHVVMTSGLPINRYYVNNRVNETLVREKRSNLLKNDIVAADKTPLPKIVHHSVSAEGIAAWWDLALVRNGHGLLEVDPEIVEQRIAVVDLGGRTTDVGVIENGILDMDSSTTIEIGMLTVKRALREKIKSEYGVDPTIPQINKAIRKGVLKLAGKEVKDLPAIMNEIHESVVQRIHGEVRRVLGHAADIEFVYFVGGTTAALEKHIGQWFPHQKIAADPSMANAQGMAKIAEYQHQKKTQK